MITHIAFSNFTQFKFCDSLEEAQKHVELFGDGRVFVDSGEVSRFRRALEAIRDLGGMCIYSRGEGGREASAAAFRQASNLARTALENPNSFMQE